MATWTPVQDLLPSQEEMVANVLAIYGEATRAEVLAGMHWYDLAHLFANKISSGNIKQGAGVIAALSPQKTWIDNTFLAARAFETGAAQGHMGPFCTKANRILAGEDPDTVLGGLKVRSFFQLIHDPTDGLPVCVDRHAFDIAVGEVTSDKPRKILDRRGGYDYLADMYRKAAAELGVLPSQVQAVTWTHWRGRKGLARWA